MKRSGMRLHRGDLFDDEFFRRNSSAFGGLS